MVPSALESGISALAASRWQAAHDLLRQAVAESPTGVALEALGEACSWLYTGRAGPAEGMPGLEQKVAIKLTWQPAG